MDAGTGGPEPTTGRARCRGPGRGRARLGSASHDADEVGPGRRGRAPTEVMVVSSGDDAGLGQVVPRGAARRRVGRGAELDPEPLWVLGAILLVLTALAGGALAVVFVGLGCGLWWLVFGDEDLTRRRREDRREPWT